MDYIEIKRTLDALKAAVHTAHVEDGDAAREDVYREAVSRINIEFERLRELLGY